MLESPPAGCSSNSSATTAQQQQMARKIENGEFADDYFASLSGPAKRLIEVSKIFLKVCDFGTSTQFKISSV